MKYIDLFAGIGGFRYGIEMATSNIMYDKGGRPEESDRETRLGFSCVYSNEWNKYANSVYKKHYQECDIRDIREVRASELPSFDLLCGGFPCQSFSIAGKRGGFQDTRGTLFFEIARIIKQKQPRLLLLENVKGLLSHDKGNTFATIISTLDELGYDCQWQVLNSKNFGVPQNRERVFIIGHRNDTRRPDVFPLKSKYETTPHILSNENLYSLSENLSSHIGKLCESNTQQKKKVLSRQQMQGLLKNLQQELQTKKSRKIQSEAEGLDSNPEGSIQVVEELNSWASSQDKSKEVCGVVQIPTEEVLLLWSRGESPSISFRQIQQQDLSFERGQDRLIKGIRGGEFGTLLLAVQPYQGRLFYSIGNGRDWRKIYQAEVGEKCNPTLNSILEDQPDPKYFLSSDQTQRILRSTQT